MSRARTRILCLGLTLWACASPRRLPAAEGKAREPGQAVSVAAAANLIYALEALDGRFTELHPRVAVTTSTGASGNLVAQIRNGAPYDVFLSADRDFAERLVRGGQAKAETLRVFGIGRLALWTTRPGLDLGAVDRAVLDPAVRRIALANPETAPYGLAARQALEKLGLWDTVQPRLVRGENVSQAAEFVETGNADAGFVALSLLMSPKLRDRGRWIEVPAGLYLPLSQVAVLTTRGAANPAARDYIGFLGSQDAGSILEAFGYRLPR